MLGAISESPLKCPHHFPKELNLIFFPTERVEILKIFIWQYSKILF